MSTYDAWGDSWGDAWGDAWVSGSTVDPHAFQCGVFDPDVFDTNCVSGAQGGVGKGQGKKPQARIYLRDVDDKRDVAELIKAKLRERYPERVIREPNPVVDDTESISEIAARNAEIERKTEISRIERQKYDDADILALIMLGMQ